MYSLYYLAGLYFKLQNKDSSLTALKVYNDIKSGIAGISAGLKVGAEQTFQILTAQQKINALVEVFTMIALLICILILFLAAKYMYKLHKKLHEGYDTGDTFQGGMCIAFCILLAVGIIFFIYHLSTGFDSILTGFINPKYGAMKEIMNFVNNK